MYHRCMEEREEHGWRGSRGTIYNILTRNWPATDCVFAIELIADYARYLELGRLILFGCVDGSRPVESSERCRTSEGEELNS